MRITITTPADPGPGPDVVTVLADDTAEWYVIDEGFLPEAAIEVQAAAYLRATAKSFFARGNAEVNFTFNVERAHESAGAAASFAIDECALKPGLAGDCEIEERNIGGGGVRRYLRDAVVRSARCLMKRGVRTTMQYTIVGGIFEINNLTP